MRAGGRRSMALKWWLLDAATPVFEVAAQREIHAAEGDVVPGHLRLAYSIGPRGFPGSGPKRGSSSRARNITWTWSACSTWTTASSEPISTSASASSKRFAPRAVLRGFAVFHETGRDRPVTEPRLDRPLAQQDAALVLGHAADDEFRVLVMDRAAARRRRSAAGGRLRACATRPVGRSWSRTSRGGGLDGAGRGNRTLTMSPPPDFESGASTSSAIPARGAKLTRLPGGTS